MIVDILCKYIDSLIIGIVAPEKETTEDDAVAAGFDFRLRPVKGSLEAVLDGIPVGRKKAPIVSDRYVGAARRRTPVDIQAQRWQLGKLSDGDNEIRVKETGSVSGMVRRRR